MRFAQWLRLIRNNTFFMILEVEKLICFSVNYSLAVCNAVTELQGKLYTRRENSAAVTVQYVAYLCFHFL